MSYRFAYRRYALPFLQAVRTAHGPWTRREGVIIRLEDEGGAVGFGEAAPISWFGRETVDDTESVCRSFGAHLGEEQISRIPKSMGALRFALYSAENDIERARRAGEGRDSSSQSLKYLPVAALLPAGRSAIGKIDPLVESGFRSFKWKVGVGDATDELGLLDDLIGRLPSGAKLRLDANGAWDRRRAERWLERAADRPIEFIEQPIAADSRGAEDLLMGLASDYPTPLALDESIAGDDQVEHWKDQGWPGFFVIKPALLGELDRSLGRIPVGRRIFSSALETATGAKAALRAAFHYSAPEPRAIGFGVWPLFADARLNGPSLAPFIRAEDVERIDPAPVWNALS